MRRQRLFPFSLLSLPLFLFLLNSSSQRASAEEIALPLGAAQPAKAVPSGQKFFEGATFIGAEACRKCHEKQYQEWTKTWHSKMERWASPETVVGDFNNVTWTFKNIAVDPIKGGKKEKVNGTVRLWRDGRNYFFTVVDRDNEKNNQTYQVAKTLGGKWDQHYETKVGENYYPTPMRWSVIDKAWLINGYRPDDWFLADGTPDGIPRRPEQMLRNRPDRASEAKCAMCHMTGYTPEFDKKTNRWKAVGPAVELGISCEKCHGPGNLHVKESQVPKIGGQKEITVRPGKIIHPLKDLNALQQIQVCTQCHGRNTNKKDKRLAFPVGFLPGDTNVQDLIAFWSYSGDPNPDHFKYFWPNDWAKRNRQQWQDFQKSVHFTKAGLTCLTCHTFHGQWHGNQLRLPEERLCVQCHTGQGLAKRPNQEMYAGSPKAKAGVTCVDCHMPKIGYRTSATPVKRQHWDTASHTFMVATPELTLRHGVRNSCEACHTKESLKGNELALVPASANAILKSRQAHIRGLVDKAQAALRSAEAALSGAKATKREKPIIEAAEGKLARATARVGFVLLDGSMGFHNLPKAEALLKEAEAFAVEVKKVLAEERKK